MYFVSYVSPPFAPPAIYYTIRSSIIALASSHSSILSRHCKEGITDPSFTHMPLIHFMRLSRFCPAALEYRRIDIACHAYVGCAALVVALVACDCLTCHDSPGCYRILVGDSET
jgi:hypothetical protein